MGNTAQYRRRRARNRRFAGKAAFHGINWSHYDHHELYDMIMTAKPEVMRHHAEQWRALGTAIQETTDGVRATMDRLLTTWRGSASTSAKESNARLEHWAGEAATATSGIGAGLDTYSGAVETAQRAMPPPEFAYAEQDYLAGKDFKMVAGPSQAIELDRLLDDQKPNFERHQAAHSEAVRVMTTYGGQSQVVHDDMPELPPSMPTRQQPSVTTGQPELGSPEPSPIPPTPPPLPYPVPPNTGGSPGGPGGGSDGTTTPSFVDPATGPGSGPGSEGSRTGVGPGFGGSGPGSGADSTRGGTGFGSGVGGGGAIPGGGPAGRGGGSAAGVGPVAARGGAGAAGSGGVRGGAGGSGGLYPPVAGAGAQGDEDKEHKNKYGEGLDLMDDLPPAYPPVFGA